MFLPANTTSLIQPLDAGIIKTFKDNYRHLLMEKLMFSENCNMQNILKSITILDAIMWSKLAFDKINGTTKIFQK